MSDVLNLVSDTTFADKFDEQNALLEDIKDALGGGSSEDVADLKNMVFPKLVLTGTEGTEFTLTKGTREITGEIDSEGTAEVLVPEIGTWVCAYELDGSTGSKNIVVSAPMTLVEEEISFVTTHIYGALWDGTSSTTWTRTDDAVGFSDPVPYAAGASSYGSPFDELMPWAGMTVSSRTGGEMVAIPKFWYKLTQDGDSIKIQIADDEVEGFNVSPAHMDRGDGKGERDVVYVGRYHCASDYKSKTGVTPVANITRSTARTSIHNLGSNIWQMDFATRFTLWMLYIVEYANWDSQTKIGYGCGNNSATENMGYTDSMPYHTGTTLSSRTTYGCSTQYRNIEGLWDNVYDWCDGAYNDSNGLNLILNPANFSDSSGGVSVGTPTNGYPSKFSVKSASGTYQMFIPSESNGSQTTVSCDGWVFGTSSPCLSVGGSYNQYLKCGLFFVNGNGVSVASAGIGCRPMELP